MKDVHGLYTDFKAKFPEINEKNEALGQFIHQTAVATHVERAREAGATEEEIVHAMLLVVPTCGFPTFMEAYREYKRR